MGSLDTMNENRRGRAAVLAIGTANPPHCFYQVDYPDFYFRVTKSHHLTSLKDKFRRICNAFEKSAIRKRYMHLTEDIISKHPNLIIYKAPSFDARQEILVTEVPKLGKDAALKAIKEWGQPISTSLTLYFFRDSCFINKVALLLGLPCASQRIWQRTIPELEYLLSTLGDPFRRAPAAVIVGANPNATINERPLFQIVSAKQAVIPDSDDVIIAKIREMGMAYYLSKKLPNVIANNIEQCLFETLGPSGVDDWNKLFYVVHPGGPAVLKRIAEKLGLGSDKLKASWDVLSEYGNMWSPSVLFALDEMRKRSKEEGKTTAATEGLKWGVLLAFGPGLTVETVVLRSIAVDSA
ncbi:hypothetical protein ES332_A05G260900v1 [Gossypium tomentosum]|uniref:Chalcone/stilbene synthase C-terminal domain-containing protein n=1 Tax=Gossypium tomentosum TaxID=34277 RepID=A0A5D2QJT7_GOSTO|nr:hypothetical protein ES332_A05G260900v1 [Gossypium tomentosum]